jgi:phage terminase large subunit-like protein
MSVEQSLAQIVSMMPVEEQLAVLEGLSEEDLLTDWGFWGRPSQLRPIQDDEGWSVCAYLGGRGVGKTRTASEWVRHKARTMPGSRGALVARTAADVRDVMIQGESGIIACSPPSERPLWEPSKRLLTWPNGSTAIAFSSEEPSQLRGPQFHWSSCDEWAAWKWIPDDSGLTAWENVRIATRLGKHPQVFAMTTPKRIQALKDLLQEHADHPDRIMLIRGTTMDNVGNLSPAYLDVIMGLYEGTRLARQELFGEMLDKVDGALWQDDLIDPLRVRELPSGLSIVVGVDPSVSENPRDECGIVVVGSTRDRQLFRRQAFVLEDASVHGSPGTWARRVVATAKKWNAPVVAEVNQGGALVRGAINGIDPSIRVVDVRAHVGKALRAEPVVLAYEQKRVHHLDTFADLESQMLSWVPGESKKSPDRVDALVHGLTALIVKSPSGFSGGGTRARSATRRNLPSAPTRRR